MQDELPGRKVRSAWLFAQESVRDSLPQPKELDIYCRPNGMQSGLEVWIGELGRDAHGFPHRLIGGPIDSGGCQRLREDSAKTRPVSANLRLQIGKTAPCCFSCFVEAASPDRGGGQVHEASPNHRAIIEAYVNLERFTQMGYRRIPSVKPSLGHRKARQQLGPFPCFNSARMRQRRLE